MCPHCFWSNNILTACYLVNRVASRLGFVSFLSFIHIPPKVFRCICYIHNFGLNFDKLDLWATKCVLVYYRIQKRYCYHSLILWQYFTNANATFFESYPYFLDSVILVIVILSHSHHLFRFFSWVIYHHHQTCSCSVYFSTISYCSIIRLFSLLETTYN
jgi:hypothetical protein